MHYFSSIDKVSGFIYRIMLVIYAYALRLNGTSLKNVLFFSVLCPMAPAHLLCGLKDAEQLSEPNYAKPLMATADMNF